MPGFSRAGSEENFAWLLAGRLSTPTRAEPNKITTSFDDFLLALRFTCRLLARLCLQRRKFCLASCGRARSKEKLPGALVARKKIQQARSKILPGFLAGVRVLICAALRTSKNLSVSKSARARVNKQRRGIDGPKSCVICRGAHKRGWRSSPALRALAAKSCFPQARARSEESFQQACVLCLASRCPRFQQARVLCLASCWRTQSLLYLIDRNHSRAARILAASPERGREKAAKPRGSKL